jgi:hypothetical protein
MSATDAARLKSEAAVVILLASLAGLSACADLKGRTRTL